MSLIHLGIGVLSDSLWVVGLIVPALLTIRYGVIAREERYLDAKFGDDYRRYKASVRRWLRLDRRGILQHSQAIRA